MTITELIISAVTGNKGQVFDGMVCCLCGGYRSITGFTDRGKVLSGNFTDHNRMKVKSSGMICDFCRLALSDNLLKSPQGKRCGLRAYSFIVRPDQPGGTYCFDTISRSEKIDYLFHNKLITPFILCFTDSGKKHISFKSAMSFDENKFWVCCENYNALFDRKEWQPCYEVLQDFFDRGVFKTELLSCFIPPWKFEKYELDIFRFQQLKKVKRAAQYRIIVNSLHKNIG